MKIWTIVYTVNRGVFMSEVDFAMVITMVKEESTGIWWRHYTATIQVLAGAPFVI